MDHHTTVEEQGEGAVRAMCSCGWCSELYGVDKEGGTMDALEQATAAADMHLWEVDLSP